MARLSRPRRDDPGAGARRDRRRDQRHGQRHRHAASAEPPIHTDQAGLRRATRASPEHGAHRVCRVTDRAGPHPVGLPASHPGWLPQRRRGARGRVGRRRRCLCRRLRVLGLHPRSPRPDPAPDHGFRAIRRRRLQLRVRRRPPGRGAVAQTRRRRAGRAAARFPARSSCALGRDDQLDQLRRPDPAHRSRPRLDRGASRRALFDARLRRAARFP